MTNFEYLKSLNSESKMADIILHYFGEHQSELIVEGEIFALPFLSWLQEECKLPNMEKGFIVGDTIRVNGIDCMIKLHEYGIHSDGDHLLLGLTGISLKTIKEMEALSKDTPKSKIPPEH